MDAVLIRRLLQEARPEAARIAAIFAFGLAATPLALVAPLPIKIAVDAVIGSEPVPALLRPLLPVASPTATLLLAVGLSVAIAIATEMQRLIVWLLESSTGARLVLRIRAKLMRHVQLLPLTYHDKRGTADSVYRIHEDADWIQHVLVYGVVELLSAALTLIGMVCVTARMNWQLALVALAVCPVLFMLTKRSASIIRGHWSEAKEAESSAMSVVQEVLGALRIVRAFGQEAREQDRFLRHARRSQQGYIRVARVEGVFDLLIGLTLAVGTASTLFLGVAHVQAGLLTLGELLVVVAYLAQLYGPLETLSERIAGLQSSLASAQRVFSLLDEPVDVRELPDALRLRRANGTVSFDHVWFGYEPSRPVLRDVSFDIPARSRVGILGRTGAGKTTLVSLLTRLYDPTVGEIRLDGVNLRDYRVADLRDQFAVVLQEPLLFSTSIAENIAYARPGPETGDAIIEAAKAANAHEFIRQLPRDYATPVGERGLSLSGGERQRVALARAFLKDAPLLILDEPTSSIDASTEAAMLETMDRLMAGRTTFLIAHSAALLHSCDLVLEVDDGRVSLVTLPADATGRQRDPSKKATA